MELLCRDAYFRAETELKSVGKAGACVYIYRCGINAFLELECIVHIYRNYALAVFRAVFVDVLDSFIET